MPEEPITFAELDRLCDLDPLQLSKTDLDKLILGMRAYRQNALAKGKPTKFSDESGVGVEEIMAAMKVSQVVAPKPKLRRL